MYFARRSLIALLLTGILLTSCGGQIAAEQATPDVNATIAAAAATLAASLFQTQTALAPTITNTSPPTVTPLATNTPLALPSPLASPTQQVLFYSSPVPTGTFYTLTPSASSLAVGCSNMVLVRDVTIPSGTVMTPGQSFTKTWQIANTGTCSWLYSYSLVFGSGDRMSGNGYRLSSRINVPVPVGEWRQVSVDLEAPQSNGTYTGYWRVANGDGAVFGSTLGVSIVVRRNADPTSTNTSAAPTATPNIAQTADAILQQTAAAAAQQTAVQNAVNTAVAATNNAAATATCGTLTALGTPCP